MQFRDTHSLEPSLLCERIRRARERLKISQEELANLVNKDQRAISEYENGKRKLSAADLPDFAEALQVPLLYFYEDEVAVDNLEYAMLAELQRLPTLEAKQAAVEIVRIFSETLQRHQQ